jgi:hypothetical protein
MGVDATKRGILLRFARLFLYLKTFIFIFRNMENGIFNALLFLDYSQAIDCGLFTIKRTWT